MHIRHILFSVGLVALAMSTTPSELVAQGRTYTPRQLERLLQRFPEADANRDGRLTATEMTKFRRSQVQNRQGLEPTHRNVRYGKHERNVLDIWLSKSINPTPLVVYIHGGGFVAGDKQSINQELLTGCLDSGLSVAAINYRFVGPGVMFPVPQHDGARAIQFLRTKSKDWNLDPGRFAAFGGSAGAGISNWIAFHDDLADSNSTDPILAQSTRLRCVATFGGQTSYDPHVIKHWIGGRAHEHPSIYKVYGVKTLKELDNPALQPLYDEVSAIKHLTKDDPPIWMAYSEADGPLPPNARPGQGIHHPTFGRKLKQAMDALGIESHFLYRDNNAQRKLVDFFKRHLSNESK